MDNLTEQQVKLALDEADMIVFMVDAKAGWCLQMCKLRSIFANSMLIKSFVGEYF